ncbi:ARC6/PARC6 family protein [Synechococcus sp. UW140]|uniref:ARC6/PARC6 family protein n=1 Tax=Synechococcus sp. UW140 TaxID=368503 RepID=UPI001FCC2AAB|nr:ARC6/PARC6 family protein [Synechococcus sp. UW140]
MINGQKPLFCLQSAANGKGSEKVELPIDHFRLLGVSPSAEAETMLRTLQLRIDRPPSQGFTQEALQQRSELLRLSSDLLTDPERRAEYEAALLDLGREHPGEIAGLELSSSREVAGLMLLWEASSPHEAFQLARQALQPPQAPALGSNREADLALLAALACRDASRQDQESRRYESAAGLLTDGLQLLQRVGKLPDQRQEIEQDLLQLTPYRILDLLSRDLAEEVSRQQGLQLLDELVNERGGLEGSTLTNDSHSLSQGEFELFFQQIRRFLTVQEQLDLYQRWQRGGSSDAAFLEVMALSAAGFSRRKPERLEEARQRLQCLKLDGLDMRPLQGCLDLLLGDVDRAQTQVLASSDSDLQQWLLKHPGDDLAALCDYCRAWLRRDVLPGFRDVDAEAVDLEAWFADRDVQAFVERLERIEGRQLSRVTESSPSSGQEQDPFPAFPLDPDGLMPLPIGEASSALAEEADHSSPTKEASTGWRDRLAGLSRPQWSIPKLTLPRPALPLPPLNPPSRPVVIGSAVFAGVVAVVAAFSVVGLRQESSPSADQAGSSQDLSQTQPQTQSSQTDLNQADLSRNRASQTAPIASSAPPALLKPAQGYALRDDQPTTAQLEGLLQAWLDRKAQVLAGGSLADARLADVARDGLLAQVQSQRQRDAAIGANQKVAATITSVEVVSSNANRIEIKAKVAYSDERLDASGQVMERTPARSLPITYILGRDGQQWRLHAYFGS